MKRFVSALVTAGLLAVAVSSHAQPVLRDGWPHDYGVANTNAFVEPNPLSIATAADGTRIIATGNVTAIHIYNVDGDETATWSVMATIPEPSMLRWADAGPVLGDIDGDGNLEVVVGMRNPTATNRGIAAYELDGTVVEPITGGVEMGAGHVDISAICLYDLDGDDADEVIYTTYDQLHAMNVDSTEVEGFPWTIAQAQWVAGPTVVPGDVTGGSPVIVWLSQDNNVHARAIDATDELTGFPVSFTSDSYLGGPVVIPTDAGWDVAIVSPLGVYVWDQGGAVLDGFPTMPQNAGDTQINQLSVGDLDGDGSPDLVFKTSSLDYVHAIGLDGSYLTGFPYSTGTGNAFRESPAIVKEGSAVNAKYFYGSMTTSVALTQFFGAEMATILPGFPVDLNVTENVPRTYAAVFPAEADGTLPIVLHTILGYTTVYNLAVTPEADGTVEWAQPFGQANGNRVYMPSSLGSTVEGSLFAFNPGTLNFGDVEVDSTASMTITVTNNGTVAGEVSAATFANVIEGDFTLDATLPVTLQPEESTDWTLTWVPSEAGAMEGTITVTHDEDATGSTESVIHLNGTAITLPNLVFPNTDVDFGTIYTDDPVGHVQIEVQNTGAGLGVIDSVLVPTVDRDVLSVDNEFPIEIEAGGSATINITWTPDELTELFSQALVFHNDEVHGGQQVIMLHGVYENGVEEQDLPSTYYLSQNLPNPFNPTTTISFGLKQAGKVTLKVFNMNGREVATLVRGQMEAGRHEVVFDASHMASGVYVYSIEVNGFHALKKMVLVR